MDRSTHTSILHYAVQNSQHMFPPLHGYSCPTRPGCLRKMKVPLNSNLTVFGVVVFFFCLYASASATVSFVVTIGYERSAVFCPGKKQERTKKNCFLLIPSTSLFLFRVDNSFFVVTIGYERSAVFCPEKKKKKKNKKEQKKICFLFIASTPLFLFRVDNGFFHYHDRFSVQINLAKHLSSIITWFDRVSPFHLRVFFSSALIMVSFNITIGFQYR
ncbi:hypothetical protein GYMLUDRAFT_678142 [Collybiopsis luxurians FD-317 M1]|uniref:Uncharacterized protein n=1 Tax=Collybiopsis luxurians FD-317 M1 TaxID=944289 RepID=A0A0D0CU60_9AGAR|nr:hypothetical protein GYMLUDRAFT_678142 [Collybiopsis luxurians FD-317 M1]